MRRLPRVILSHRGDLYLRATALDTGQALPYVRRFWGKSPALVTMEPTMKVRNSLKSLRDRHQKNQLVRRRGRLYVINKVNKRFKARQG